MKLNPTLIVLILFLFVTTAAAEEPAPNTAVPPAETVATNDVVPPSPTPHTALPEQCVPQCRAGFMCHAGMCISQCNPPCGAGSTCTAQGECVVQQGMPLVAVAPAPVPTERELARQQAREKKQQIREQRREAVKHLRLSVHMDWQWMFTGEDEIYRTGFMGNLGLQKNVADTFAFRARIGGMLGYARPGFFDDSDRTTCWGANIDFAPLFGPLGTFYVGPMFWLTYYWHADDQLEDIDWYDDSITYVDTQNGPTGGVALDMGIVTGDTANLGINWRVKTTLTRDPSFIFEFGLAYHFDVGGK